MNDSEILEWVAFAKGGPGSGAQPGHPFNGNQWGEGGGSPWRNPDGTPSNLKVESYIPQTPAGLSRAGARAAAAQIAQNYNMSASTYDERVQQVGSLIPQNVADAVTPHDMAILEDENYHATAIAIIAKNPALSNFPPLSHFGDR